jgi:hypothetical protein
MIQLIQTRWFYQRHNEIDVKNFENLFIIYKINQAKSAFLNGLRSMLKNLIQ